MMRKNAWVLKVVSLALVMVMTIGFLPPMQTLAADTENDDETLGASNVATSGITLSDSSITLEVEETHTLTYTLLSENAEPIEVLWQTSDIEVATVEDGVITAIAEGTAEITVRGVEDTSLVAVCAVEVVPAFAQIMTMGYGNNSNFLATIEPPVAGSIPISTRAQLEAIKNNLSGNYHLTADIDLSGAEWIPIGDNSTGSYASRFTGIFDGQGYVISNLRITGGNYDYCGLFGYTYNATIKNVGLENTDIDSISSKYIGAVCGYFSYSSSFDISNCYNTGSITVSSEAGISPYIGGICGDFSGNNSGIISNCYNTASISVSAISTGLLFGGGSASTGGICGRFAPTGATSNPSITGSIKNCFNTGDVFTSSAYSMTGGIIGQNFSVGTTISNSYNTGSITSITVSVAPAGDQDVTGYQAHAGGICGYAADTIIDCYNLGDVSATCPNSSSYSGGICSSALKNIKNCYNLGSISASTSYQAYIGGIYGYKSSSCIINNCYCLNLYGSTYGTQLTTAQMKDATNFIGFDFTSVWDIDSAENDGYPYLRNFGGGGNPGATELIISSYSPTNGQTSVSESSSIILTFNNDIFGDLSGVALKKYSDDTTINISATPATNVLTITPDSNLELSTQYYVEIPANAIHDGNGNYFTGLAKGNYQFTTGDGSSADNCPIIIIPGVMGSRLFEDTACKNVVWGDVLPMVGSSLWGTLGQKMTPLHQLYAREPENQNDTNVVREYGALQTFEDLVDSVCTRYPNREVYFFSYDFRQSCTDSATELQEFINDKGFGKVDLVCHSMGGIVASQYVVLSSSNKDKINKVITMATPYEGSPQLLNAVMNWDLIGNPIDLLLGFGGLQKSIKISFIGAAQLCPTERYVNKVPFYERINKGLFGSQSYLQTISYNQFIAKCEDIFGSNYQHFVSYEQNKILENNIGVLANLPNSYFGVGTSKPTIGSIIFEPGKNIAKDLDFVNGDGTVPYTSATMMNQLKSKVASNRFREFSCDHTKIIQELQPINWVLYLLGTQTDQAPNNIVSNPTPYMVLRAACPVDITIAKGQETLSSSINSFNPTTDFGSLYFLGEDNDIKIAVIDDDNYSVQMVGAGTGTMDYSIRFFGAANNLVDEKNFWDVPITGTTIITTSTNINDSIALYVDTNGDGIVDKIIQPSDSQSQNNTNYPSSSSDRGTSNTNTYTNVAVDPLANLLTKIKTAVDNAAKETPAGQPIKAIVQVKNANKITLALLKQAADAAKKAGGSVTLHFDTMSADGKTVLTRIYVKPELATSDIVLSVNEARAKSVKSLFEKYFKNKIAVVSFDQQGSFGMPVEIAAKVDLSGMDTKNLYFYSYDKKANTYRRIEKPAYWIDKNGYLHFTTELAGDIVISEGSLARNNA